MINFNFETEFSLKDSSLIIDWITKTIHEEDLELGEISYIFCDDIYLLEINKKYLNHDTLTDIISFDYSENNIVSGDIFISIEMVKENSKQFQVDFLEELHRVIIHGILHYCGYKDKSTEQKEEMRSKENYYLSIINF